jgi:peptidyl-tRNA hydrolase, PTH1 family
MGEAEISPGVMPQLIVGLGNPGAKYDRTRHNIGFDVIDWLARQWQIQLTEQRKFQGIFGEGPGIGGKIRLLKPQTYMNLSGQSMRAVVDWYKLSPEAVLVIYDDMDLPVGKLRLRQSGSAGGHNGMKSAIAHLGTQNFPRLRIGIGSPKDPVQSNGEVVSHVLGRFSPAETKVIAEVLQLATEAIELGLRQGIPKAMSLYNNRSISLALD